MNAPVNAMSRRIMSVVRNFRDRDGSTNLWAQVILKDSNIFQGTVVKEQSHGIYLSIGGSEDRLSLFPWRTVDRVIYQDLPEVL